MFELDYDPHDQSSSGQRACVQWQEMPLGLQGTAD